MDSKIDAEVLGFGRYVFHSLGDIQPKYSVSVKFGEDLLNGNAERGGSGKLNSTDKWIFPATVA
jgi:hypothetical protein